MATKIFIASSTKSYDNGYVDSLKDAIDKVNLQVEIQTWTDSDTFRLGEQAWDSLIKAANEADKAFFIFSEDDLFKKDGEGEEEWITRDNVVLEYGLFTGIQGKKNVCIIKVGDVYIPSDIQSITYLPVKRNKQGKFNFKLLKFERKITDFLIGKSKSENNSGGKTYFFIKIDVVDSSYFVRKERSLDIEIFDKVLSFFWEQFLNNDFIEDKINLVNRYDDILLIALHNTENVRSAVRYFSDYFSEKQTIDGKSKTTQLAFNNKFIKEKLIQEYPEDERLVIKDFRDFKFRISIIQEKNSQINNNSTFTHFRGKSIKVSRKFKFYGNYNSISVDKQTWEQLSDSYQKQFIQINKSIENHHFYGLFDLLNTQVKELAEEHFSKGEYTYAAMMMMQYIVIDKEEENPQLVDNILDQINKEDSSFPIRVIKSLLKYKFQIDKSDKKNSASVIGKEYKKFIEKRIQYLFHNERKDPFYLHYLLRIGISPKNYFPQKLIENLLNRKGELNIDEDNVYHDNCILCSSKIFYTLNLLIAHYSFDDPKDKIGELRNILISHFEKTEVQDRFYCIHNKVESDLRYPATLLTALLVDKKLNPKFVESVVNIIFSRFANVNWLINSEHSAVEVRGIVFSAIAKAFGAGLFDKCEPELIDELKLKMKEEFSKYIHELEKYLKYNSVLGLDGVEGLIDILDIGLDEYIGSERNKAELENIIKNYHQLYKEKSMIDTNFTGLWGFEKQRTYYRLSFWFKYWEYKLKIENAKNSPIS